MWEKFQFLMRVWVVARLPQRLKSMFFEKISSLRVLFGNPPLEKMLILAFDVNSAIILTKWTFSRNWAHCTILWIHPQKLKLRGFHYAHQTVDEKVFIRVFYSDNPVEIPSYLLRLFKMAIVYSLRPPRPDCHHCMCVFSI